MKFDIDFLSFVSVFIPLVIGLFFYRRVLKTTKIIILLIGITTVLEIGVATFYYLHWNNLFFFHLHTFIEFILLSWVYIEITRSARFKTFVLLMIPAFLIFSAIVISMIENAVGFNSTQRHVESTLLVIYILYYLMESRNYRDDTWYNNPFLLFSIALITYLLGSLFVFIFANQMFESGDDQAWAIHGILNILLNLTITATIFQSIVISKR